MRFSGVTIFAIPMTIATGVAMCQTKTAPADAQPGTPAGTTQKAVQLTEQEIDALLKGVQITKAAKGTWKCVGDRTPCTDRQVQALQTTVVKSRSNTKDNLLIKADGTLTCTILATGKPCSDTEMQETVTRTTGVRGVKVILGKPGGSN